MSASLGINLAFATYPVIVAWAIGVWGWQWAFTLAVAPSLFVCGLAVLGIENVKSGLGIDEISQ